MEKKKANVPGIIGLIIGIITLIYRIGFLLFSLLYLIPVVDIIALVINTVMTPVWLAFIVIQLAGLILGIVGCCLKKRAKGPAVAAIILAVFGFILMIFGTVLNAVNGAGGIFTTLATFLGGVNEWLASQGHDWGDLLDELNYVVNEIINY